MILRIFSHLNDSMILSKSSVLNTPLHLHYKETTLSNSSPTYTIKQIWIKMPQYYKICSLFPQDPPKAFENERRNYGHIWPKLIEIKTKKKIKKEQNYLKKQPQYASL